MKILMITEFFPPVNERGPQIRGGIESRCYYIARELAKIHHVTVIASHVRGTRKYERVDGIEVLRCGRQRDYSQGGTFWARLTFMWGAYKNGLHVEADIVEGSSFMSYIPTMMIGRKKNISAIAWYADVWLGEWINHMGLQGVLGEMLERYVLTRRRLHFIAISEFTKRKLVRAGIPATRIHVLPMVIDIAGIESVQASITDAPIVCCVARFVKYKRIEDLIRAVALLKPLIPTIRCRLIGWGPMEECLRALTESLGLKQNVEFLGAGLSHEEVYRTIKSSALFCLPSIVEGFGAAVAVAMACGTPYVCSDIDPIKEITNNGVGGLLFKARDEEALSKCLYRLFTDRGLYNKSVKEGYELARQYDYRTIATRTVDLFQSLCAEKALQLETKSVSS